MDAAPLATLGFARAQTLCYVTFLTTFTGFDRFTYQLRDNHGGYSEVVSYSIEIFRD